MPLLNFSEVSEKQLAPLFLVRLPWILKSMLMQGGDGNAELACQDKAQWAVAEPDWNQRSGFKQRQVALSNH